MRCAYTSVDMLTNKKNVRFTARSLRPRAWCQRSGAAAQSIHTREMHERGLRALQRQLNCVPFRRTANPLRFS